MARRSGAKGHDISGGGEEGYSVLCAGCKSCEKNRTRALISPSGTVKRELIGERL